MFIVVTELCPYITMNDFKWRYDQTKSSCLLRNQIFFVIQLFVE